MNRLRIKRLNRYAISPVISSLLLILITVSASGIMYAWTISMVKNQTENLQTQFQIDSALFGQSSAGDNGIFLAVRNTGTVSVTLDSIFLFRGDAFVAEVDVNTVLPVGTVKHIGVVQDSVFNWDSILSGGKMLPLPDLDSRYTNVLFSEVLLRNSLYMVRVVADNGFEVTGPYYTPAIFG